ncbi:SDR family oxidoreductase [Novosphingobium sp. FSY-8]|uniref:SDR family oxidoreductase n=1 Tax=Novosphingobium ovatum TaxID=1908523 RepID=A0ABW9XCD1_9SPHN|nr:SDR family oxidoreductase [Novosphingobium ovatum]NBC36157.1 SDR family oxidoreductase [Novosphingobium ovatum]
MKDLDNRVAVITGGAGGLGGATARELAGRGARVIITDLAEAAGTALAAEIGGQFIRHDVTDQAQWAAVRAAADALGGADILVNAAGIEGDFDQGGLDTSLEEWRRVIGINLDGTFLGCKTLMPGMLEKGKGAIVNIASIITCMGTPSGLAYGASKSGVEQLSRSLALIGARDGKRVRVNSVHPGTIRSRMLMAIIDSFSQAANVSQEEAEAVVASAVPMREIGEPEDIAGMIGYLVSDTAKYVTGAAMRVDGGWSVTSAG